MGYISGIYPEVYYPEVNMPRRPNSQNRTTIKQARAWMITLNNPVLGPDAWAQEWMNQPKFRYLVFQKERGLGLVDRIGTEHYQAYVEFTDKRTFRQVKLVAPTAHIEARTSTAMKCRIYCMKEETRVAGPWEHGKCSFNTQGTRADLATIATMVKDGKSNVDIFEYAPGSTMRYLQHINRLRAIFMPERTTPLKVTLIYGKPGTGKTEMAHGMTDLYRLPVSKDLWMDNYGQQKNVLIDDFNGNVGLSQWLQIIDKYAVQVPIKGGFVWWCPEQIVVTTNVHPLMWYKYEDRQDSWIACSRRFHKIMWHRKDKEPVELESAPFFHQWAQGCDEERVFKIKEPVEAIIPDENECTTTEDITIIEDEPITMVEDTQQQLSTQIEDNICTIVDRTIERNKLQMQRDKLKAMMEEDIPRCDSWGDALTQEDWSDDANEPTHFSIEDDSSDDDYDNK